MMEIRAPRIQPGSRRMRGGRPAGQVEREVPVHASAPAPPPVGRCREGLTVGHPESNERRPPVRGPTGPRRTPMECGSGCRARLHGYGYAPLRTATGEETRGAITGPTGVARGVVGARGRGAPRLRRGLRRPAAARGPGAGRRVRGTAGGRRRATRLARRRARSGRTRAHPGRPREGTRARTTGVRSATAHAPQSRCRQLTSLRAEPARRLYRRLGWRQVFGATEGADIVAFLGPRHPALGDSSSSRDRR